MKSAFFAMLGISALFGLSGCGGLLDSLRDESAAVDREAGYEADVEDDTQEYRPRTLRGLSANNVNSYDPPVVRGYGRRLASFEDDAGAVRSAAREQAAPPEFRRYTRNDFVDSKPNENSLWDSQGQGNYLFAHNRERQPGDLITVDVEKELKREIQYQLWMTLPPSQRKPKRVPASTDGTKAADGAKKDPAATAQADKATEEKNKDEAAEAAKTNMAPGGKDDDIVRMEVAENLGNGMFRMIGQKKVIYRGVSRVVEIMALVNNKDVDDSGRVKSSAFLDMKTQVIQ